MRKALSLAKKGKGTASPNPVVGAVIVKNNKIISQGFHKKAGEPHAEAVAISKSNTDIKGSTMYVTLEPCNHYGRTPPCSQKIIKSGIKKVVIAMEDPNPVASGGIEELKKNGIKVISGVLKEDAIILNRHYIWFVKTGKPWFTLKTAMTIDGRIATFSKNSKWITGDDARRNVHYWRKEIDGIMVGAGTVLSDNPLLTAREVRSSHQPVRIVIDPDLKIPLDYNVFNNVSRTIVFAADKKNKKIKEIENRGHKVFAISTVKNKININKLTAILVKEGLINVGVEGGAFLYGHLFEEKVVNEIRAYYGMKILGNGLNFLQTENIPNVISDSLGTVNLGIKKFKNGDFFVDLIIKRSWEKIFS